MGEMLEGSQEVLEFMLSIKVNLEYYGFHSNWVLTFDIFKEFFEEKPEEMQEMVQFCSLKE